MGKRKGVKDLFEGRHFDREVIILCVRWYLRFKLSPARPGGDDGRAWPVDGTRDDHALGAALSRPSASSPASTPDRNRSLQSARCDPLTTIFGNVGSTEETLLKNFPSDFRSSVDVYQSRAPGSLRVTVGDAYDRGPLQRQYITWVGQREQIS